MEIRKEWLEIRDKVARLHPAMELSLKLFRENISESSTAAKECDPRGIAFAIEAAKLSVALRKDVEHLRAAGIIDEEDYSKFTHELVTYRDSHFDDFITEFGACVCRK